MRGCHALCARLCGRARKEGRRGTGHLASHAQARWFHILTFMPKIDEDIVRAVLDAAKIEDVVGDFVTLRKAGVNLTGLCPFHDDKSDGNFIVRPSTASKYGNTYHCFACMRAGEGGGPVDFLMKSQKMTFPEAIRWLGNKYHIPVDDVPLNWTPPPARPTPPPLPVLKIPREWVQQLMGARVNDLALVKWWRSLPWDGAQRKRLEESLWLYCVGAYNGRIVWWLIDEMKVPRSAKLMDYYGEGHERFGHRNKERHPGWIYNQEGYKQVCLPDAHQILKPLFGMHLLDRFPHATVCIVESEKTAVTMATAYGNHEAQLWMACGGLENINRDKLAPIMKQGRRIILYPDRDGVEAWTEKARELDYINIAVDARPVTEWWKPEDGDKADIADVVVRSICEHSNKS